MSGVYIGIIVVIGLLFLLWSWSCCRLWKGYKAKSLVKFGSQSLSGQLHPNGEPIYLPPTVPSLVPGGELIYRHWALKPNAPKIAVGIQCLTMVIMLIALILDRWTQRYSDGDVILGLIFEHYGGWWASYAEMNQPVLATGGALTLAWCVIGMIVMCALLHQTISIFYGKIQYQEYHYALARLQFIQLWYALLMWLDTGCFGRLAYGGPGPSWIMTVVCLFLSWWMLRYFRAAIEFRPPPSAAPRMSELVIQSPVGGAYNPAAVVQGFVVEGQPSRPSFPSSVYQQQQYQPLVNYAPPPPPMAYQLPPAYAPHAGAPAPVHGQVVGGYAPLPTMAAVGGVADPSSVKRFCYSCGTPVPVHLQMTVQFCSSCGTKLAQ